MITEPKIEDRNEQSYVGVRAQVTMQELGKTLPPLWGEVYGWLASKGVKPAGAPLWRYLVIDMAAKLEIDVGVPVATPLDRRQPHHCRHSSGRSVCHAHLYRSLRRAHAGDGRLVGLGRQERHCLGQVGSRFRRRGLAGAYRELPHRPQGGAGLDEMANRAGLQAVG